MYVISIVTIQAVLWKEDFQRERHDREQAAGLIDDERGQLQALNQQLQEKLQKCHATIHRFECESRRRQDEMRQLFQAQHREHQAQLEQANRQLQDQKVRLEQTNQLQRAQLEVVQRQLRKVNQQLDQVVTDSEKLEEQKAEVSAVYDVRYMFKGSGG